MSGSIDDDLYDDLYSAFRFARDYAVLWRHVTEAWFLAGMIDAGSPKADQCRKRLGSICDMLVEWAVSLPENSQLVSASGLWGGADSPILTANVRASVRALVDGDLRPRASQE